MGCKKSYDDCKNKKCKVHIKKYIEDSSSQECKKTHNNCKNKECVVHVTEHKKKSCNETCPHINCDKPSTNSHHEECSLDDHRDIVPSPCENPCENASHDSNPCNDDGEVSESCKTEHVSDEEHLSSKSHSSSTSSSSSHKKVCRKPQKPTCHKIKEVCEKADLNVIKHTKTKSKQQPKACVINKQMTKACVVNKQKRDANKSKPADGKKLVVVKHKRKSRKDEPENAEPENVKQENVEPENAEPVNH
jgi:hypothetical protein